jgi:hypothetical protein
MRSGLTSGMTCMIRANADFPRISVLYYAKRDQLLIRPKIPNGMDRFEYFNLLLF